MTVLPVANPHWGEDLSPIVTLHQYLEEER
jgi:hypothetical protein